MYEKVDALTSAMNSVRDALDELKEYQESESSTIYLLNEAYITLEEHLEELIHTISEQEQKERKELEHEYYSSLL